MERFQAQRVGLIRDLNESLKTKKYYAIVGPAGEFEPIADPEYLALLKRVRAEEAKQIASDLAASAARDKAKAGKEGVSVGMSKEQVLSSSWGKPEHVNTTTTARGTREQWVYGMRAYLYFEDGVLTTIQN